MGGSLRIRKGEPGHARGTDDVSAAGSLPQRLLRPTQACTIEASQRGRGPERLHSVGPRAFGFSTTTRDRAGRQAPDLVERRFQDAARDQLWVADITYIPTATGFLYLAVVVDAWSRRVVGWSMATHLRTELVLEALDMAITQAGEITDKGCITQRAVLARRTAQVESLHGAPPGPDVLDLEAPS